jgi:hypothetical protein
MRKIIVCCGILLLLGASCAKEAQLASVSLPKGTYEVWNDKPFAYRACAPDTFVQDSFAFAKKPIEKDTTLEISSFAIEGENTFVHNEAMMWVKMPLPFSAEEQKYLRFLFPIDRKKKDCKMLYGYFLNKKLHKIYINDCIVDLKAKKCNKIDMGIYEMCYVGEEKWVICKIKNSPKSDKWNEEGEKL